MIHLCEKALLIDSDNVKAKFRMASANKGLGEYEKSLDILRDLLSDPSVQKDSKQLRSIKKEVAEVRRLKKEQFNAEKKMFGGFMKFVDRLYDTEEYSYEDLVFDGSHEEVSRSCCHRLMTWLRQIYEKPFGKRKITLNKRKEKIL